MLQMPQGDHRSKAVNQQDQATEVLLLRCMLQTAEMPTHLWHDLSPVSIAPLLHNGLDPIS
jgi:hypothetical protein